MKEQQLLETSESKIDKIFHSVASLTAPRQPKPKKQLSLFFGPGCSGIDDQLDCRRDKSKPAAPAENEQITRNKETQLAEVAEILRQDLSLTLEIRGYASNIGELRDNIAYSQARAFAVASYLANKGIAMTRMSFAGLATAENSRRVDIALFGSAGP